MATISYLEYIASSAWRALATEAKRRAGWTCALCPATDELEAHHRTYERLGRERPEDIVVLCGRCHRRHHGTFDEAAARQLALPLVSVPEQRHARAPSVAA